MALFGPRRTLPPAVRSALEQQGVLLLEENLGGSVVYRDFRAPGRYSSLRIVAQSWALALSTTGLLLWAGTGPFIDVAWTEPRLPGLRATVDDKGRLVIAWDAGLFRPDWSGTIEAHVAVADPAAVLALLRTQAPGMAIG
jgi:hypothetical protein